mgnify:CR=1 FL=1
MVTFKAGAVPVLLTLIVNTSVFPGLVIEALEAFVIVIAGVIVPVAVGVGGVPVMVGVEVGGVPVIVGVGV